MLIAFEGGEGTGKSTQARLLAERLGDRAVLTFQPGATAIGAAIRRVLLDPATTGLDPRTEALLMAADRAQHVAEVIAPALAAGKVVITDRYLYSSVAYQGYGRELGPQAVAALSAFATGGRVADLVVLLVVPPSVRDERLAARGAPADRLEQAGSAFHERVEAGYRAQAAADPDRWLVIDGDGDLDEVTARVWHAVAPRLSTPPPATRT
jgi:dTMP kinase